MNSNILSKFHAKINIITYTIFTLCKSIEALSPSIPLPFTPLIDMIKALDVLHWHDFLICRVAKHGIQHICRPNDEQVIQLKIYANENKCIRGNNPSSYSHPSRERFIILIILLNPVHTFWLPILAL